eukprot:COSAG01_NODE_5063_length_4518_cov_2.220923_4_plen_92_part_00
MAGAGLTDVPLRSLLRCGAFQIGFGADGAIDRLSWRGADGAGELEVLADPAHPLARAHYQGMDADYFRRYHLRAMSIRAGIPELTEIYIRF